MHTLLERLGTRVILQYESARQLMSLPRIFWKKNIFEFFSKMI
jgi:hypothetical protein